jgi:hypothetical protein
VVLAREHNTNWKGYQVYINLRFHLFIKPDKAVLLTSSHSEVRNVGRDTRRVLTLEQATPIRLRILAIASAGRARVHIDD